MDRIVKPRTPRYSAARPAATYSADTEVLTRDGWKTFPDATVGQDGDQFATRDSDGRFEWQAATHRFDEAWTGELQRIKGRTTDLLVTPEHSLLTHWAEYRDGDRTHGQALKPVERLTKRGAELPCLSEWSGAQANAVTFGRYQWDAVTFASFLGAWLAEGSLGPARKHVPKSNRKLPVGGTYSGSIVLTQLPDTKGYEPYRELLIKMLGREPCRSMNKNWVFSCSPLWRYLSALGKAATKHVPTDVKNWGRAELEALLKFYLLGDGWVRRSMTGREFWGAVTVSSRLAGDLQEVAQKTGQFATIKVRQPRDAMIDGREIKASNCLPANYLFFNTSTCRTVQPVEPVAYAGTVHSVAVPNGTLYVRRQGSPVWSGSAVVE